MNIRNDTELLFSFIDFHETYNMTSKMNEPNLGVNFLGISLISDFLGLGFFECRISSLRGFLADESVVHSRKSSGDLFRTFDQRQEGDDDSSTKSPSNGDQDPEGKVVFGENTGRDRKERPDDNQDQGQDVSTAGDPAFGTTKHGRVLLGGTQTTFVLFDQGNCRIQGGEVVFLGIDELGVDIVDQTRRKDGDEVTGKHDLVGTKSGDGDRSRLDLSSNEPSSNGQDQTTPCGDDGTGSRGLVPGHQVPQRNDGRSNNNSHEKVDPSKVEPYIWQNFRSKN